MIETKGIRDKMIEYLKKNEIGCSIYYPHPIPRLSYYQNKYGFQQKLFPNAIDVADKTIALPVGQHIGETEIKLICKKIDEGLNNI